MSEIVQFKKPLVLEGKDHTWADIRPPVMADYFAAEKLADPTRPALFDAALLCQVATVCRADAEAFDGTLLPEMLGRMHGPDFKRLRQALRQFDTLPAQTAATDEDGKGLQPVTVEKRPAEWLVKDGTAAHEFEAEAEASPVDVFAYRAALIRQRIVKDSGIGENASHHFNAAQVAALSPADFYRLWQGILESDARGESDAEGGPDD